MINFTKFFFFNFQNCISYKLCPFLYEKDGYLSMRNIGTNVPYETEVLYKFLLQNLNVI